MWGGGRWGPREKGKRQNKDLTWQPQALQGFGGVLLGQSEQNQRVDEKDGKEEQSRHTEFWGGGAPLDGRGSMWSAESTPPLPPSTGSHSSPSLYPKPVLVPHTHPALHPKPTLHPTLVPIRGREEPGWMLGSLHTSHLLISEHSRVCGGHRCL